MKLILTQKSVLSVEELTDQDELDFESHAVTDAPGLVLHKGNSEEFGHRQRLGLAPD